VTDTVQQLAADLTREAQETGLNWVQELADRATALAGERRGEAAADRAGPAMSDSKPLKCVGATLQDLANAADNQLHVVAGHLPQSELPDWEGVPGALEHRTVGSHRAWCFNDGEWCYPESELMCPCCHGVLGHEEMWFDPKVGPPERAILTDLITELREGHPVYGDEPPLWARLLIDRAEARLREVQGE